MPWIDHRYRTIRSRSGRAIVGISQGRQCQIGAATLIAGIMTGLNQVQPFAPFGDPVTDAANWKAHDPGTIVKKLAHTRIDLYTSEGVPGKSDLTDPAVPGTVAMEAILHQSNLCFRDAADAAGVSYHWHSYLLGTHAWPYGDRALKDYLPRLMGFFRTGR